jgi:hypothetical protein
MARPPYTGKPCSCSSPSCAFRVERGLSPFCVTPPSAPAPREDFSTYEEAAAAAARLRAMMPGARIKTVSKPGTGLHSGRAPAFIVTRYEGQRWLTVPRASIPAEVERDYDAEAEEARAQAMMERGIPSRTDGLGGFIAGMFGGTPGFKVGDVVMRVPRTFDGRMRTGARPLRRYAVARVEANGALFLVALSGGKVDAMPEFADPGAYTLAPDQTITFSGPFAERFARNYERIKAGGGKLR